MTASGLCSRLMTKALFLGQACHDSFHPQGSSLFIHFSIPGVKKRLLGGPAGSSSMPEGCLLASGHARGILSPAPPPTALSHKSMESGLQMKINKTQLFI